MSQDWPLLYRAILEAQRALFEKYPDGLSTEAIGLFAWEMLTSEQQAEALPDVLSEYVQQVNHEVRYDQLQKAAADPSKTYLGDFDVTIAWDSTHEKPNEWGEVTIPKDTLANILAELELLQHRRSASDSDRVAPVLRLVKDD